MRDAVRVMAVWVLAVCQPVRWVLAVCGGGCWPRAVLSGVRMMVLAAPPRGAATGRGVVARVCLCGPVGCARVCSASAHPRACRCRLMAVAPPPPPRHRTLYGYGRVRSTAVASWSALPLASCVGSSLFFCIAVRCDVPFSPAGPGGFQGGVFCLVGPDGDTHTAVQRTALLFGSTRL